MRSAEDVFNSKSGKAFIKGTFVVVGLYMVLVFSFAALVVLKAGKAQDCEVFAVITNIGSAVYPLAWGVGVPIALFVVVCGVLLYLWMRKWENNGMEIRQIVKDSVGGVCAEKADILANKIETETKKLIGRSDEKCEELRSELCEKAKKIEKLLVGLTGTSKKEEF